MGLSSHQYEFPADDEDAAPSRLALTWSGRIERAREPRNTATEIYVRLDVNRVPNLRSPVPLRKAERPKPRGIAGFFGSPRALTGKSPLGRTQWRWGESGANSSLGAEGEGFKLLMAGLQQERLVIAVQAIAGSRRSLDDTIAYVKERKAFGQPVAAFQNTQFKLAELATEVEVGQAFVDKLLAAHARDEEIVTEVSMAKYWASALHKRLAGECLQLFGGYGFMKEYPISQDYADAAVPPIYGGTNEIMKVIIARNLGLA